MALYFFILAAVIGIAFCGIHHFKTEQRVRAQETARTIAKLHVMMTNEKRLYLAERDAA
jgi:hypothetical protein